MIISKLVIVRNSKYYKDLGYGTDKYVEINVNDLSKGSKVLVIVKCDYCGFEKSLVYKDYYKNISSNRRYACSSKCAVLKSKETNLDKYGVDNPMKCEQFKNKGKETNIERYGVEYSSQSNFIKDKIRKTNLERYGVDNPMKSAIFINKMKDVNLEKYGVTCTLHSVGGKVKTIKSNLENHGGHNTTSEIFRKNNFKISNNSNYIKYLNNSISLFKCDYEQEHNFSISSDTFSRRNKSNISLCTVCNPIGDSKSIKEKDLQDYIQRVYNGEIISSYRDVLEIDIYLPELKIGFEFNGLYWHSDKYKEKNYHLDKTNYFKDKGIRIIHIWEDDWTFKKDIVKSQISNILNLNTKKIFARKCIVREITCAKLTKQFLEYNHIQGMVNSSIKLGLYYGEELVSIMIFDSFEGRKKMEKGGYNLSRFCNKIGINVVGGASKLLSSFIKNYDVKTIVSYADKDWSIGKLYYTLGFNNISESKPDYKYIVGYKRVHKSRYKKSKLNTTLTESKQMKKDGFLKVYDCGKIKFEYRN